MKIIRADVLGFCAGVRIAVEKAEKELSLLENEDSSCNVYSFGPLIHNPVALKNLESRGLKILDEENLDSETEKGTVIIRAHGIAPLIQQKIEKKGFKIINATCPRVIVSQKKAADFAKSGFCVILAGDKNHGEVIGIKGYAEEAIKNFDSKGEFYLIENREDAALLAEKIKEKKCVFLSQTTFSPVEFNAMADILSSKIENLKILATICPATKERQDALEKLCGEVDGVIVIGGKKSANSGRLFQKAKEFSKHAAFIENEKEIPEEFYALEKIGITAGASTPDSVIEKVEKKLLEFEKKS